MSHSTRHLRRFVCLALSALFFHWYFFSQLVQRSILALRNNQRGNRRWTGMAAFTEEVANARIWAGFPFATRLGTDIGRMSHGG
jgi:hypothetical protein